LPQVPLGLAIAATDPEDVAEVARYEQPQGGDSGTAWSALDARERRARGSLGLAIPRAFERVCAALEGSSDLPH